MTDDDKRIRKRLRDGLQHYSAKCLRIRTKAGAIEPLTLNRVQRHLHERLERQRGLSHQHGPGADRGSGGAHQGLDRAAHRRRRA